MIKNKKSQSILSVYKLFTLVFLFFFFIFNQITAQETTGGDDVYEIEIDGKTYRVHAFKTVGNHQFVVNQDLEVDILVVGGGGGGGSGYHSAGGGGGGVVFNQSVNVLNADNNNIVVGDGSKTNDSIGQSSKFNSIEAFGGGSGGYYGNANGTNGASGGGGAGYYGSGGIAIYGQGNNGGRYVQHYGCGGGGGAGGIGQDGQGANGGMGGEGLYYGDIFGNSLGYNGWFGGGGGGSAYSSAIPGNGRHGGGDGASGTIRYNPTPGFSNTGGGGGGASYHHGTYTGGSGGSGIVIVRYEINQFNLNINNSTTNITPTKSSPNYTLSGTIDYPEDGDATSVVVSATIGGVNRNINVPVSDNMIWQLSWNYNNLSEGEYTDLEFNATSNSSTPEETTSTYTGKIIIDKTSPTCGSWSPAVSPWKVSGGQDFTLTSSTDVGGSGLATASASVSCSTGPIHGDTCPVTIEDKAGNDKICTSPINRVDIFPPTLTVTPAITGWQGDKQDIIVLSEDNETSLSRIAYAWDLNTLGSDCSGGTTINSGDNLRLTISGGANPLYVCSIDLAGNVSTFTNIYQYIPPVFSNPKVDKNVKPSNLYWNIQSISETQRYVEVKGFFPKTTGTYNYALEYIIPTINKSFTQALRTSPFTETHFTFLIPTTDFKASKDNHTFSGPQKLKITDLDQMEATTIDHNLSFFFPIHQTNHRTSFNYFILANDNRLNEVE